MPLNLRVPIFLMYYLGLFRFIHSVSDNNLILRFLIGFNISYIGTLGSCQ